jgi:hypothetical protein
VQLELPAFPEAIVNQAVDCTAWIVQQAQRLVRLSDRVEVEPAVGDVRFAGADARRAMAANGADQRHLVPFKDRPP